jgi:hypothetical protein
MHVRKVIFAMARFGLAVMFLLGLSSAAQQAIQFTKPVDADPASKANSFLPDNSHHLSAKDFNAPSPLFGSASPTADFDILPGSPPPVFLPNAAQWQKYMDQKKNWALLTPGEILGIPTPEKILGITDPLDDPAISLEERYLRRQGQQSEMSASNSLRRAESPLWHSDIAGENLFGTTGENARYTGVLMVSGMSRNAGVFIAGTPDPGQGVNPIQKTVSAWASPFESPPPLPKPTPKQLAGMDRFRAIMAGPAPEIMPAVGGELAHAPDPNMQATPFFNPAGQAVAPLSSGLIKPTGITPLSGVTGPQPQPKKAAPVVQPPPWLQNPLQSGNLPQRQY